RDARSPSTTGTHRAADVPARCSRGSPVIRRYRFRCQTEIPSGGGSPDGTWACEPQPRGSQGGGSGSSRELASETGFDRLARGAGGFRHQEGTAYRSGIVSSKSPEARSPERGGAAFLGPLPSHPKALPRG